VFGTIRLANSPSLDHEPTSRTAGPLAAETGRT
jgi:hypothetical protein